MFVKHPTLSFLHFSPIVGSWLSLPMVNVPKNLGLLSREQYSDTILTPIPPHQLLNISTIQDPHLMFLVDWKSVDFILCNTLDGFISNVTQYNYLNISYNENEQLYLHFSNVNRKMLFKKLLRIKSYSLF